MVVDTYVIRKLKLTKVTEDLNRAYGEAKARKIAKKNGWTLLKSVEVDSKGQKVQRLQFVVA
jgi:hypothetical protein